MTRLLKTAATAVVWIGLSAGAHAGTPTYQTDNLTSNRYSALPAGTLQVIAWYDGSTVNNPTLSIQYFDPASSSLGWIVISNLPVFTTQLATKQYALNGAWLTGNFQLNGITADGGVDGIAFGLFWRDAQYYYHVVKSNTAAPSSGATYAGAWPMGYDDAWFLARTPQITDSFARETIRAVMSGAKLLQQNGGYSLPLY